jgi:hypothetical protein
MKLSVRRRLNKGVFALCFFLAALAMFWAASAECAWQPYSGAKSPQLKGHALTTAISDPVGDTFGAGPVQIDIVSFSATSTTSTLIIRVDFNGPVSLPDSGQPNALSGFIDFDTDQIPATGAISHVDIYSPYSSNLGVDYYVDLNGYSSATQDAGVYDSGDNLVGRAPVSFTSNSLTVRVPLALIGNSNAIVNTATVVGTPDEATDAAPNGDFIISSREAVVPTFSQWGLVIFYLLLVRSTIWAIRRRKA